LTVPVLPSAPVYLMRWPDGARGAVQELQRLAGLRIGEVNHAGLGEVALRGFQLFCSSWLTETNTL
jgi:hypothetical protein